LLNASAHDLTSARQHRLAFALLIATSILAGWAPLFQTGLLAVQDDKYTQILLVLPISASLLFFELRSPTPKRNWNFRLALPLLGFAIAIAVYAHAALRWMPQDVHLAIQMCALVVSWISFFVLCFGVEASQSAMFPLLLLLALVPLPQCILNPIIASLQVGSAWCAHALFAAFGIPAIQKGVQIAIPGLTIEVAQECSSIRSSSMLLLTAIVLAQFVLQTFWRKAFIAFIALPLSVAKNGLRIFIITFLGTHVDPGYLNGRLHHQGGIFFFLFALACIFAAIWICRRWEVASRKVTWAGGTLPEAGMNK
jgi:exosortase